jgi:hypothetical protein
MYRGATLWLFRNGRNGAFEDVTAKAGLFDATSKSLGVTLLDYDLDAWPDVFVANDTQPNKLYRNNGNGTFTELGLKAGLAFSEEGRARAGMGVDAADVDNSGKPSVVVTNFSGEMLGLYRPVGGGQYSDVSPRSDIGRATRHTLGFGCFFFDVDLDGLQDLLVGAQFRDIASSMRGTFSQPKVGRGAAFADIDEDGDPDVLITSNGGPVHLYRNDVGNGYRAIRLTLRGTKSNRDAIGARVTVFSGNQRYWRMVKTGSSYLSQSELPLTFGLASRPRADRVVIVIEWPSGAKAELDGLPAGVSYEITEGKGITAKKPLGR